MPDLKCLHHIPSHWGIKPTLDKSSVWDTQLGGSQDNQKHQQFLIHQMLPLIHSPRLHLDHPNGKLISSRRNEFFLLPSYGFPSSENPFQVHTALTKQSYSRQTWPHTIKCLLHLQGVPSWHCQVTASSWGSLHVITGQWSPATSPQPRTTLKGQAERDHLVGSNE